MDEGSLLVYPELILKGKLPYRDFETFYGPANLWVLSGAYAGFGANILVERAVGLCYRMLILAAIFGIAQRWGALIAAGCTLVAGLILSATFLPAYAWIGGVMCALWSIWLLAAPESRGRCLGAGLFAGAAFLFRPDLALAVIASALPLFLLMPLRQRWLYLAGGTASLVPLAWLALATDPKAMLNNLLLYPVIYSSPGRHMPIFSADGFVVCLFFAHLVAATANVIVGAAAVQKNRRDPLARLLLSMAIFALGLTHQAAQRLDLQHVTFAAFASFGLLPLSSFVALCHLGKGTTQARDAMLSTACVIVVLQGAVPELTFNFRQQSTAAFVGTPRNNFFFTWRGRSFPIAPIEAARAIAEMFGRLESQASRGDRLFVGPADLRRTNYNDTFIYHLLPQFPPATYFLEMNPFSANRPGSRLVEDIASADWLVLNRQWDSWNEQNRSNVLGSDEPAKLIAAKFELCGRYGPYELYHRESAPLSAAQNSEAKTNL